jgi:hypothetical protein
LSGKISVHSLPVVAVAASLDLDLSVSIDEENYVVFASLITGRVVHVFQIDCPQNSAHPVRIVANGVIAISWADVAGHINFYDLCGTVLGQIDLKASIEGMADIQPPDYRHFLCATTSAHAGIVVDCHTMSIVRRFGDIHTPQFVDGWSGRGFMVVRAKQESEMLFPISM